MMHAARLVAVVLIAALAPAAPASAKKVALKGQVIGQPYAAKKRTVVPVLLTARSARRAKLGSRLGEVHVRAARVRGPRGSRIPTRLLRANDRFRARTKVRRRARGVPYWHVPTRKLTVTRRSKTLSAAELQALVDALRGDLSRLSQTVEELARYTVNGFRALNADLALLASRVAATTARLDALEAALAAQSDRIAGLEDQLDAVLDDVGALGEAFDALGARLTTLEGEVDALGGTIGELLAGVGPGDLAGALGDVGELQADLATLGQQVDGLQSDVDALCGPASLLDSLC